jgi:hypothetical protein
VPAALQAGGQLQPFGDLSADVALVEQPQRLVVDIAVQVALLGEEVDDPVRAPARPVMLGEHHVAALGEEPDRLVQVARPAVRIAHDRSAQGKHVVQVVGGVLGDAQRPPLGEQEVHLRRRLGVRRELEHHVDAVDRLRLTGPRDLDGRRDQRDGARRGRLAEPGADLPGRALGQQRAVHVRRAARHRAAGVHVLAHGMLEEPLRGEHGHAARCDVVRRHHAARAAEVVDVAVRVEQARHRPVAAVLAVERERRRRALGRDQRIDHEDAAVALDDGHHRQVQATHLIDPFADLEQPVDRGELALPPQTRIDRVRAVGVEERIRAGVPHDAPVRRAHHRVRQRADEPAPRILEVLGVRERQAHPHRGVRRGDLRRHRGRGFDGHAASIGRVTDVRVAPGGAPRIIRFG